MSKKLRFEVSTLVRIKNNRFFDVVPCILTEVY
jgi:hypothetical protein